VKPNKFSLLFKQKGNQAMSSPMEPKTETIAETENYMAWQADEPDGETTYHLELNNVTMHFFTEEWEEFLALARAIIKDADGK
jgi:hypothetical protein